MTRLLSALCIVFCIQIICYGANITFDEIESNIIMFYTDEDNSGTRAMVRGIVSQVGVRERITAKEKELGQSIQDRTKITVRISSSIGIIPGSVLYVINDRNLIVAKISVYHTFRSSSMGHMCVGFGNFRNVKNGYRVAQLIMDNKKSDAYIHVSKGNYYRDNGDISKATESYQKAIAFDANYPEAHMNLGYIYLDQKLVPFALKEFEIAYAYIGRVYDREDRYLILKGAAESRFIAAFNSELPKGNKLREKYVDEGIEFSRKAVTEYPDSIEVHYYLGRFYYDRSVENTGKIDTEADERVLKEMEKVISLDENHLDAHIILAKLYKKHSNREQALFYAQKAMKIDPASNKAREIYKSIKGMK
jgi:hypothetical protein